ncbi:MAG: carbonic anhydrase [Planctomycetota bacterium]
MVVCGHYACGGVQAAHTDARVGLVDSWLQPLRDLRAEHQEALEAVADEAERVKLLSELSVITQVREVARTNIVRDAWNRG